VARTIRVSATSCPCSFNARTQQKPYSLQTGLVLPRSQVSKAICRPVKGLLSCSAIRTRPQMQRPTVVRVTTQHREVTQSNFKSRNTSSCIRLSCTPKVSSRRGQSYRCRQASNIYQLTRVPDRSKKQACNRHSSVHQ
jgi:hypothetical protein